MADYESNKFGDLIIPPHSAGEVYVSDDVVEFDDAVEANDIAAVGHLPAGCVPIDVLVVADELDSHETDTLTYSVGLLNDDCDDLAAGSVLLSGSTADATVNIARGNAVGMMGIAPDDEKDRTLGVKITAAAATAVAGGMRVVMTYRASNYGA